MRYFLGVDIGGTKSHALLADESGRVVGFGKAGCGTHEVLGYAGMSQVLQVIVGDALTSAGIQPGQVMGAGFGMAGYDWPTQRGPILAEVARLGLGGPGELVNDALIGLYAGSSRGWGVAVIGGTGCNAWGVDRAGRYGRVTGNGGLFGEHGGAITVVSFAIEAVSRAWSMRGPDTLLTEALLHAYGSPHIMEFQEGLVTGKYRRRTEMAPLVFEVAQAGDPVAVDVLRRVGEAEADLALGVVRQLGFQRGAFDLVMVGSLWNGGALLIEPFRETVLRAAPGAELVRLPAPPVVGGVLLGMRQAGLNAAGLRPALLESWRENEAEFLGMPQDAAPCGEDD